MRLLPLALLAACSLPSDFDTKLSEAVDRAEDTDAAWQLQQAQEQIEDLQGKLDAVEADLNALMAVVGSTGGNTLAGLGCSAGQVPSFNGSAWGCATLGEGGGLDTLSALGCTQGQIAQFDGLQWACLTVPDDLVGTGDLSGLAQAADVYTKTASDSRYLQAADLSGYAVQADVYDKAAADGRFALGSTVTGLASRVTGLEDGTVSTDLTWNVSDANGFLDALDDLDEVRIGATGSVTLQLADGTYPISETIAFRHPDGARVRILGNTSNAEAVVLQRVGTGDLLTLGQGAVLDELGGVTLVGSVGVGTVGLMLDTGAVLDTTGPLRIEGFETGLVVQRGGVAVIPDLVVAGSDVALLAVTGGIAFVDGAITSAAIRAQYGAVVSANDAAVSQPPTAGLSAIYGAVLRADSATVTNGASDGVVSQWSAVVDGRDIDVHTIGGACFSATWAGTMYTDNSTCTASLAYGYRAQWASVIDADNTTTAQVPNDDYLASHASVLDADALGDCTPSVDATSLLNKRGYCTGQ